MISRLAVPRLAAVVVLTCWLTACGPDASPVAPTPADPGYRSLPVQDEASLGVTATGMMAAIGCTPVLGRPDSTAIALPLLAAKLKFYRCPGVRAATLLATAKAIRAVTAKNPVWASALSGGAGGSPYYEYDHTECVWQESTPPEYGQRINADGDFEIFVVVTAQPGSCAWMAIYKYKVPGGDGAGAPPGSWGPTGPTQPLNPLVPPSEPLTPDSIWTAADECDHLVTGCLVKLDDRQGRYFQQALDLVDPTHPTCRTALGAMRSALEAGKVFIGSESIADGHEGDHSAITDIPVDPATGKRRFVSMHFDQDDYRRVKELGREGMEAFAQLMLHEAMHSLLFLHPKSDGQSPRGYYSTPPFNLFNPGSSANGCLRPR
ncbi:MAG: hypothetical protein KBF28_14900 [Gemmatimonadales bacterium]|nr:hypothetical protein [Gemmatimonadales bacterium]